MNDEDTQISCRERGSIFLLSLNLLFKKKLICQAVTGSTWIVTLYNHLRIRRLLNYSYTVCLKCKLLNEILLQNNVVN